MDSPTERPFPHIEPRAELRAFASALREMYAALQQEGFTPNEAMTILGTTIASNMGGGR